MIEMHWLYVATVELFLHIQCGGPQFFSFQTKNITNFYCILCLSPGFNTEKLINLYKQKLLFCPSTKGNLR